MFVSGVSQAFLVPSNDNVTIVSRAEWGARDSREINYMGTPVSVVFIHHTAMSECFNQTDCAQEMRVIQNFHMDDRGTYYFLCIVNKIVVSPCYMSRGIKKYKYSLMVRLNSLFEVITYVVNKNTLLSTYHNNVTHYFV